jgi:hypothetical protein
VCYYSDGSWEFFEESVYRAAKVHRCCECRRVIRVGDRYQCCRGVFDGCFVVHKSCLRCVCLREAIGCIEVRRGCAYHESVPCFGELWEAIVGMDWVEKREVGVEFVGVLGRRRLVLG